MEQVSAQPLAASLRGHGRPLLEPLQTGRVLPRRLTRKSPEMLQSRFPRRSQGAGRSREREIPLRPRTRRMRPVSRVITTHPPLRMLTATTGTVVSMKRSVRSDGRTRATIYLMTRMMRARDDHVPGGELPKEREKDSTRHHEEEEASPVLHPDRRVSLMGWRVMRLSKSCLRWQNVSKSRHDRLPRRFPLSKISTINTCTNTDTIMN